MTQYIDTGGPAFPCVCTNDVAEEIYGFNNDVIPAGTTCQYRGLTMRDWFAGKAMQAMVSSYTRMATAANNKIGQQPAYFLAIASYEFADAMLRAREQQ